MRRMDRGLRDARRLRAQGLVRRENVRTHNGAGMAGMMTIAIAAFGGFVAVYCMAGCVLGSVFASN